MNDPNEKYISANKITKKYDITSATLRRWAEENKIRCLRTTDGKGKRIYHCEDIKQALGIKPDQVICREIICYARVSSTHQKSDLERQVKVLNEAFPQAKVFQDIGSGLNFKRQGFVSLLQRIYKGDIEQVVVTYKDRLCRFGFELFEWILKQHDTKLLVLNESFETQQNVSNELAEDLIAVTNYFVAKNNGLRSAKYKKARKQNNQNQVDEEPNKEMQTTS
jgi:predicted site-specific integrase-resolvase